MRLSTTSLLGCLLAAAGVDARHGQVYLPGPQRQTSITSLTPSAARIVLAEQLGVSRFHSVQSLSQADLDTLNSFDVIPNQLFSQSPHRTRRKAVLLLEGIDDVQELFQGQAPNTFQIDEPPSPDQNKWLMLDFVAQHTTVEKEAARHASKSELHHDLDVAHQLQNILKDFGFGAIFTERTLTFAIRDKNLFKPSPEALDSVLLKIRKWTQQHEVDLITVAMQPEFKGSIFKRSVKSNWGTYERAEHTEEGLKELKELYETPIPSRPVLDVASSSITSGASSSMSTSSSSSVSSSSSAGSKSSTTSGAYTGPTTPPRGILPSCFSSLRTCRETTHNCSGHGSCDLQYSYKEKNDLTVACYACSCKAEVTTTEAGKKTTVWTGPACQKKDLTVPFWLLAGFTIAFVSILYWGIGLLYSMGSEDLPSVIGAGVAGPRAK